MLHYVPLPLRRSLGRTLLALVTLRTVRIFRCALPFTPSSAGSSSSELAITCLSEGSPEFTALCRKFGARDFADRLQGGHEGFVATIGGEVVGFLWMATNSLWIEEIEYAYRLPPGEAFIYDGFVDPAFRGRGIYPALITAAVQRPRPQEFDSILIAALASNPASLRGITKAGFRECERIRYRKILGLKNWQRVTLNATA